MWQEPVSWDFSALHAYLLSMDLLSVEILEMHIVFLLYIQFIEGSGKLLDFNILRTVFVSYYINDFTQVIRDMYHLSLFLIMIILYQY